MTMIMQDRSERLAEPLKWGRREKTAVAAVLSCVVLIVLGLGAYALTSGAPRRAGCIELTFASTLGAAEIHACGARARTTCASPDALKGIAAELRDACHKAGYPYGGAG
jgi:hypothetical protein